MYSNYLRARRTGKRKKKKNEEKTELTWLVDCVLSCLGHGTRMDKGDNGKRKSVNAIVEDSMKKH